MVRDHFTAGELQQEVEAARVYREQHGVKNPDDLRREAEASADPAEVWMRREAPEELRMVQAAGRLRDFNKRYADEAARYEPGFVVERVRADEDRRQLQVWVDDARERGVSPFPNYDFYKNREAIEAEREATQRKADFWRKLMVGDLNEMGEDGRALVEERMSVGHLPEEEGQALLKRELVRGFMADVCGFDEMSLRRDFRGTASALARQLNKERGLAIDERSPVEGLYGFFAQTMQKDAGDEKLLEEKAREAFRAGIRGEDKAAFLTGAKEAFGGLYGEVGGVIHGQFQAGRRQAAALEAEYGVVSKGLEVMWRNAGEDATGNLIWRNGAFVVQDLLGLEDAELHRQVRADMKAVADAVDLMRGLEADQKAALYEMFLVRHEGEVDEGTLARFAEAFSSGMSMIETGVEGVYETVDLMMTDDARSERMREQMATKQEMVRFLQGEYKPLGRGYGTIMGGVFDATQSLPLMATSMMGLPGLVAASGVYGGNNMKDAVADRPDGFLGTQVMASLGAGLGEASLDRFGGMFMARAGGLMRGSGLGSRLAGKVSMERLASRAGSTWGRGAVRSAGAGAAIFGEEFVTENVQDTLNPLAQHFIAGADAEQLREFFGEWTSAEHQKKLAAAILPFAAVGASGRMWRERATQWRLSQYEGVLSEHGVTDAELKAMRMMPTEEGRNVRAYELAAKAGIFREVSPMFDGREDARYEGGSLAPDLVESLNEEIAAEVEPMRDEVVDEGAVAPERGDDEVELPVWEDESRLMQAEVLSRALDLEVLGMPVIEEVMKDDGTTGHKVIFEDGRSVVYDEAAEAADAVVRELSELEETRVAEAARFLRELDGDEVGGVRQFAAKAVEVHLQEEAMKPARGEVRVEREAPGLDEYAQQTAKLTNERDAMLRLWGSDEAGFAGLEGGEARVMAASLGRVLRDGSYAGLVRLHEGANAQEVMEATVTDNVRGLVAEGVVRLEQLEDNLRLLEETTGTAWLEPYDREDGAGRANAVARSMGRLSWAYALGKVADKVLPEFLRRWVRRMVMLFAGDARVADMLERAKALVKPEVRERLDDEFLSLLDGLVGVDRTARTESAVQGMASELVAEAAGLEGERLLFWVEGKLPHPDSVKGKGLELFARAIEEAQRERQARSGERLQLFAPEEVNMSALVNDARKAGFDVRSGVDLMRTVYDSLEFGALEPMSMDWEVAEDAMRFDAVPAHRMKTFKEARAAIDGVIGEVIVHPETGLPAKVTNKSRKKMTSSKAVNQSVDHELHNAAVSVVDKLWMNSRWRESHEDRKSSPHVRMMHRYESKMLVDGDVYQVKLTVKEMIDEDNVIYTVEVEDVERAENKKASSGIRNGPIDRGQYPSPRSDANFIEADGGMDVKEAELHEFFNRQGDADGGRLNDVQMAEAVDAARRDVADVRRAASMPEYEVSLPEYEVSLPESGRDWREAEALRAWLMTAGQADVAEEHAALLREALKEGRPVSALMLERYRDGFESWCPEGQVVRGPADAFALLAPLRNPWQESVKVMVLDDAGKVVTARVINVGKLGSSPLAFSAVVRCLFTANPEGGMTHRRVLVSHNHPGGDPKPSSDDYAVTAKLKSLLESAGAELYDHVITNGTRGFSFESNGFFDVDEGLSPEWEQAFARDDFFRVFDETGSKDGLQRLVWRLRAQGRENYAVFLNSRSGVLGVSAVGEFENGGLVARMTQGFALGAESAVLYLPRFDRADKTQSKVVLDAMDEMRVAGMKVLDVVSDTHEGVFESMTFDVQKSSVKLQVRENADMPGVQSGSTLAGRGYKSIFATLQERIEGSAERKAELLKLSREKLDAALTRYGFDRNGVFYGGVDWVDKRAAGIENKRRMAEGMSNVVSAILRAVPTDVRGRVRVDSPEMLSPEVKDKAGNVVEKAVWKPSLREQLMKAASEEQRLKVLGKVIERLDAVLEDESRANSVERMKLLFKWAKPKKGDSRVARGKLTAEIQEFFKDAGKMVLMSEKDVAAQLAAQDAIVDEAEDLDSPDVRDALDQKERLEVFGGLFQKDSRGKFVKDSVAFERAVTELQETYKKGRERRRRVEELRRDVMDEEREGLMHALGFDEGVHASESLPAVVRGGMGSQLASFARNYVNFEQAMVDVFGDNEVVHGHVEALRRSRNAYERKRRARAMEFWQACARVFAKDEVQAEEWAEPMKSRSAVKGDREVRKILADLEEVTDWGIEIRAQGSWKRFVMKWDEALQAENALTGQMDEDAPSWMKNEECVARFREVMRDRREMAEAGIAEDEEVYGAVEVYEFFENDRFGPLMLSQNQAAYVLQLAGQEGYADNLRTGGFTEDVLAHIREHVDERAVGLARFFSRSYEESYQEISEVYARIFGISMPQVKHYAPGAFWSAGTADLVADPMQRTGSADLRGVGAIKGRVVHKAAPRIESAMTVFLSHYAMMDHWVAYAEALRDFKGVFLSAGVKQAVTAKFGSRAVKQIQMWADAIEGDGAKTADGSLAMSTFARKFLSARAMGGLSLNAKTLLRQIPAVASSWVELEPGEVGAAFKALWGNKAMLKEIWNDEAIRHRVLEGMSPEMRQAMERRDISPGWLVEKMRLGMLPIGLTDAAFTTLSAFAAYHAHYERMKKQGLKHADAKKHALDVMDRVVKRTAQPVDTEYKSLEEVYGGVFQKTMMQFLSDPRKQAAITYMAMREAARDWNSGKDRKKIVGKAAWKVFNSWVMYGMLNAFAGDMIQLVFGLRDDEEDVFEWEDYLLGAALGAVEGVYVVGSLVANFAEWAAGRKVMNFDNSFIAQVARLASGGYALYETVNEIEGGYEDMRSLVDAANKIGRSLNGMGVLAMISPEVSAAVQVIPRATRDVLDMVENIRRLGDDDFAAEREMRREEERLNKERREERKADARLKDEVADRVKDVESLQERKVIYEELGLQRKDWAAMERRVQKDKMPERLQKLTGLPLKERRARIEMYREKMTERQRREFDAELDLWKVRGR